MVQEGPATCLAYHPRREVIAAGFASGSLRLFQPDDAEILADIRQRSNAIGALHFAANGRELYSFSEDGHLVAYQTESVCCSKLVEATEPPFHCRSATFPSRANVSFAPRFQWTPSRVVQIFTDDPAQDLPRPLLALANEARVLAATGPLAHSVTLLRPDTFETVSGSCGCCCSSSI